MARTTTTKRKPTTRGNRSNGAIRTYRAALNYLNSTVNFERTPLTRQSVSQMNLGRIKRLASALGNPQNSYRIAHVAGTKGKGSTVAMLTEMLKACGLKVGTYTSPHVMHVRERIAINGEDISESQFAKLMNDVATAASKPRVGTPTYFELLTAAAFLHFEREEVDIAVIETGMGGRLDATNIVKPDVVGITSVNLDHTGILGETLEAIAVEKAGVFKPDITVVASPQTEGVTKVLRQQAEEVGCPIQFVGKEIGFSCRFESSRALGPHTRICLTSPHGHFEHVHSPLCGDHQSLNCAVALGMLAVLKSRGVAIDEAKAIEGLSKTKMQGRMEMISDDPRIMVDGAHNAASVDALMRAIGQNVPYDSMVIIFGCQKDKDISGMLRHIRLGADKIIFVGTGAPRSADPQDLAATFSDVSHKMFQVADDLDDALSIADRAVGRDDLICITGSFQLVARAKRLIAAKKAELEAAIQA